jgi:hypothetical protein
VPVLRSRGRLDSRAHSEHSPATLAGRKGEHGLESVARSDASRFPEPVACGCVPTLCNPRLLSVMRVQTSVLIQLHGKGCG